MKPSRPANPAGIDPRLLPFLDSLAQMLADAEVRHAEERRARLAARLPEPPTKNRAGKREK